MDVASIVASMPPDVNVFDYMESLFISSVFPGMGTAFWAQCLVSSLLCCIIILLFAVGLGLRAYKRCLSWLIHDGAASHVDPLVWIPLLWIQEAAFLLALTVVIRVNLTRRYYTSFIGAFWTLAPLPLVLSYALLSASMLLIVPKIRRLLVSFNSFTTRGKASWPSVILVHAILILLCGSVLGSVITIALQQGDTMADASVIFSNAIEIIRSAKASGDISALSDLAALSERLATVEEHYLSVSRHSGIAYTVWQSVFVTLTIVSAYILTRFVRARIARYERASDSSSSQADIEMPVHIVLNTRVQSAVPTTPDFDTSIKLPADRPFASLLDAATPMLAPEFQAIVNDRARNAAKANRLREKLRQKHYLAAAQVFMLVAFFGWAVFSAADGRRSLSAAGQISLNYAFYGWSFLVPALPSSVFYVWKSWNIIPAHPNATKSQELAGVMSMQQRISFVREAPTELQEKQAGF